VWFVVENAFDRLMIYTSKYYAKVHFFRKEPDVTRSYNQMTLFLLFDISLDFEKNAANITSANKDMWRLKTDYGFFSRVFNI